MEENELAAERGKKLLHFLKTKSNAVSYFVLALIVWLAVYIRTANLPLLKDITTGGWALGPDLDPYLFLRWAKYIVAHGSLYALDPMRYVPLGFNTKGELLLHPYMIAWFHKIAVFFGSTSVDQSAVIYPVFFWAITVVAFFFLSRKIFLSSLGEWKSNAIGLVSSLFLTIIPSILPRTIAGIPEKESAGFFFLFAALYLFVSAWKAKSTGWQVSLAILAGITTAMMSLVWGGYIYIYVTIGLAVLISFMAGQIDVKKYLVYSSWLISSMVIMHFSSTRYTISSFLTSETTLVAIIPFILIGIHLLVFNTRTGRYFESEKFSKVPKQIISIIITLIVGILLGSIMFGPFFVIDRVQNVVHVLINPITDRLGVTVAENRQPEFTEWGTTFGPVIKGIPVFFWLFFVGSVYLFNFMTKHVFAKRERIVLVTSYTLFLLALIFSRYSSTSVLNGSNGMSTLVYAFGFIILLCAAGYYYYKYYISGEEKKFSEIDFGLIIIFSFFFFSIVSARGAVRLIMVLVPSASILASYLLVASFDDARKVKDGALKFGAMALVVLILLMTILSAYSFYNESYNTAKYYAPSSYNQQWQKAMSWVRENTSTSAVFGHWWDYGYWLQSIGNRATVVDGGNEYPYWDYLMGRYGLTATDSKDSLEFLYSHNTTHFLIDSSDIGKYSAFSSIGSDENYDRLSWIPTFQRNDQQTQETKSSTVYLYNGGTGTDSDIFYNQNGTNIFLPGGRTEIAGVFIEKNSSNDITSPPIGVYIYQNQRYDIPLRYAYSKQTLHDFGTGLDSGVFLFPRLVQSSTSQGVQIEDDGAMLFLSNRTVNSQVARLYLFNENDPYFKLVHSEDDFVVAQLKTQGIKSDFVLYDQFRGPIRIWQINYPAGMKINPIYLQTDYPNVNLTIAK